MLKLFNQEAIQKAKEQREFAKEKQEFEAGFFRLMFELGLYNKFNRTYWLDILDKTNYGFKARIALEPGLSFQKLSESKGVIQENLCCIWIMTAEPFEKYAYIKIVTHPLDKNLPYANPEIKPWELYLGLDFSLNVIKNNCNNYCMFLLAGAVGTGKTRFIYMILLSWILGCSPQEVEIYLSDIAKNEFINFQYVRHIRYYASELMELWEMMMYLNHKINVRKKVISRFREQGLATNIEEYNAIQKVKMTYCYLVIDELSIIVPDKTDSKDEKEVKEEILAILKKISKIGRSLGVFCFVATQKTTRDEIPSIIKNMSAVRISFRANDMISSEVIIGDNSAVGLADRYAIYSTNGGERKDYLFSPCLTTDQLKELLKPHIDKNYPKLDFSKEMYVNPDKASQNKPTAVKEPAKKNDTPYEVINTAKVKMESTAPTKTSKPVKKGDGLIDY